MKPMAKVLGPVVVMIVMLGVTSGVGVVAQTGLMSSTLTKISGQITAIDARNGMLKLAPSAMTDQRVPKAKELTVFLVDAKAVIFKEDQPLKLEQLKVGDQVEIEYLTKGNRYVARSIIVQPPTAEAPTKQGAPTPQSTQ